ncbi:glycoside hydrolase family 27 protein [Athelia psychrophila]|uniref:Alpha-galactosidase n=1 Tax=Athelia psychrophila TaxID=1759441 RepID=A0A166QYF6_9AGAM|nr:glycoside hydrolase family 27 protein [Fibularhizoctonia sp. CBS 109695]KZP27705.1 glycoside hydrolase family 27 protein [Fibularhizoctonia sp. CBS 109695]
MLFQTSSLVGLAFISSVLCSSDATTTVTGLAASAPTAGPSKLTGSVPALGWNGWNAYGCGISATNVLAAANQMVSLGLQAAGYQYVNIDDCWALTARNTTTMTITPDPSKFPKGISGLAADVHALGLKIGIYSDAGTETCSGFPGSLGYEAIDAATFSSWGIDYNCNVPSNWSDSSTPQDNDWYNSNSAIRYRQMAGALAAQSRPIQFDLCIWGNANVWTWGARVGHSWRMAGDTSATWSYITSIIVSNVQYLSYEGFYAHNDMDMMEIGNGDLTIEEQRTHFAAWCFLKSPILLGTDLSLLSAAQIAIVTNAGLLAFHQDATYGAPAFPFTASASAPVTSPPEYYSGQSSKGIHVFIINIGDSAASKTFSFANVPSLGGGPYTVHDMWAGADVSGTFTGSYTVTVAAHDSVAFLVKPSTAFTSTTSSVVTSTSSSTSSTQTSTTSSKSSTTSSTSTSTSASASSSAVATVPEYGQCAGVGYTGSTGKFMTFFC